EQRARLTDALINLPVTTLVFLKHFHRVEFAVRRGNKRLDTAWTVTREHLVEPGEKLPGGFTTGLYRVVLSPDRGDPVEFLLAHGGDLAIGEHRGGLDDFSWEGVEYTEVSVAARLKGERPVPLAPDWRRLHVFLPSDEPCPYNLLVSGAFSANLSRQDIRIERDARNYNRFLLHQAARLVRDRLVPSLLRQGASVGEVLRLLDRGQATGGPAGTGAAQALYEEVRTALQDLPFILREVGEPVAPADCIVPPLVDDVELGRDFRAVLPADAAHGGRSFPAPDLCGADTARILVDHGAHALGPTDAAAVLAGADEERSRLWEDLERCVEVDPVLSVLERLWEGLDPSGRGEFAGAVRRQPLEEWDIVVPDVYPAYISYDQYLQNRQHLQDNLYNFTAKGRGAPRGGRALLQGLVICGRCGRRMRVSHGSHYLRYECRQAQIDYGVPLCQAFPVAHLDHAAGELFLEAVRPAAIETTLAALGLLERERQALDRHWQLRLERARYDVQRAQRQYDAIEPENRLVARTLETRWNAALQTLEQLEQDYAVVRRTELLPLDETEQQAVRHLAEDLPALWHAETTTGVDRKRLLRLVVTEMVLTVEAKERCAEATILWSGGTTTRHVVRCPPLGWHGRTVDQVIARLCTLACELPDHQIAERLNAEGLRTRTGKEWTYARVHSIRKQHGIASACPLHTRGIESRADSLMPVMAAARRLGVSSSLVHVWIRQGALKYDQRRSASRIWVSLTAEDLSRLDGTSPIAPHLPSFAEVMRIEHLSRDELWDQVRKGKYQAFRVPQGQCWEWRLRHSAVHARAIAFKFCRTVRGDV
ncbi:MAG: recombinase zinc beta ribbon domain-containing protein, partial [Acetobacteraceae bacterium]|nr:recombinase zinc beta ribbon domain-containing protein [Acetobacteraceae bacterium]